MNATGKLQALGQSLWLDNITRDLLDNGGMQRYIDAFHVTGLTSNPTIFEKAITGGHAYDDDIRAAPLASSDEAVFNSLALADLRRAADLFAPVHAASAGVDGWVSMEVSPLLVDDAEGSIAAAIELHKQAARNNLYIKIPGTKAGVTAIEECIFAGVPINVTLLFSSAQYEAAANAWLRGIERRIEAGRDPAVSSVGSVFISRWDVAVQDKVPVDMHNQLGIAVAQQCHAIYRQLLQSPRWLRVASAGAPLQRLLWASTGSKDPAASETLYVEALAAADTIDTIPEKTLHALAENGRIGDVMSTDENAGEATIGRFVTAGIDIDALAEQLQREGAQAFSKSWHSLMHAIAAKRKGQAS